MSLLILQYGLDALYAAFACVWAWAACFAVMRCVFTRRWPWTL